MNTQPTPVMALLGVEISLLNANETARQVTRWAQAPGGVGKRPEYVALTGMHGLVEAYENDDVRAALRGATLAVPDGYSVVAIARHRGYDISSRAYGPEIMSSVLEQTRNEDVNHFFYGGPPGVAERLAHSCRTKYPGLTIVGTHSPPFRDLTDAERADVHDRINSAQTDVLWVGLSTPKQELFMHRERNHLTCSAMLGVGAAFDFLSGRKSQAPPVIRNNGMEWLWRLASEPRRLWKRTVLGGAKFACLVLREELQSDFRSD